MSLLSEREWRQAIDRDPGSTVQPIVRRKAVVDSDSPLRVRIGGQDASPCPAANISGWALDAGDVVWVDLIGDGRVQVVGVVGVQSTDSPVSEWQPITLTNGWSGSADVMLTPEGIVFFRGQIHGTNNEFGQLPGSDLHPPSTRSMTVVRGTGPPHIDRVNITPDGTLSLWNPASGGFIRFGSSFYAL